MIHSHSAVDPTDPDTIAGRWLALGAFAFFGSVHEPFLDAFRPPGLVAELIAAGFPLVTALRQGPFEPLGRPWRLVYLGDPLYRLEAAGTSEETAARLSRMDRLGVDAWRWIAPEYAAWRVGEIAGPDGRPGPPAESAAPSSEDARLAWCRDAAIGELVGPSTDRRPAAPSDGPGSPAADTQPVDWLGVLRGIHRDRLDRRMWPVLDDLLIDALSEAGAFDELHARLIRFPTDERSPRVWQALESCTLARLARLAGNSDRARDFGRAMDLWDEVIRLGWPSKSEFPSQLTERVAGLAALDGGRRLGPWRDRLRRVQDEMAAKLERSSREAVVAAELKRVEDQIGRRRFW
jgi:hypothetical protein